MNYRHAFHAGNHADILKHLVLLQALQIMTQKPAALAVLDTHAGIGRYDLAGDAAARSPEWRDGIARLRAWRDPPPPIANFLAAVGDDPMLYPGSPLLTLQALRPGDRLIACELHPDDVETLRRTLAHDRRAQVHHRDGYAAVQALLPFPERRGLILIDPPYEASDDVERAIAAIRTALQRFRQAVIVWWRPIKASARLNAADAEIIALGFETVRFDLAVDHPEIKGGLKASSVFVVNPPYGLAQTMSAVGAQLADCLRQGDGARFETWLAT